MQDEKILVFGKDGQVGKALQRRLANHAHATFVGRAECDLTSEEQIKVVLQKYQPQIIINASAYTAVDKAEVEKENAMLVNGNAPQIMAEYVCSIDSGQLVHYSTDYVFDGLKTTPYEEDDATHPLGQYGKSKLAGEQAIKEAFIHTPKDTTKYFILRTSWVYGDGGNFIKTMLKLAAERDQLKVISDQFGVPTSAEWLADIAIQCISSQTPSGIYHAVPDGETTWHGLACFAIEQARLAGSHIKIRIEAIQAIPATQYPLPAPRPYNSRMSNLQLKNALHIETFPKWDDQVREYVKKIVSP
jgi:dTDP-4-dehydrorhamnose reductase